MKKVKPHIKYRYTLWEVSVLGEVIYAVATFDEAFEKAAHCWRFA